MWAEQYLLDGADRVQLLWCAHVLGDERHPVLCAAVDLEVLAWPDVLDEAELVCHALVHGSEAQQQLAKEVDIVGIAVLHGDKARRRREDPKARGRYGPVNITIHNINAPQGEHDWYTTSGCG